MNYLFYDLETTGLCESFDQVVRFASITTNENFEDLDRNEISIQLISRYTNISGTRIWIQ